MALVNLYAGWIAILVGLVAGASIGLFFHREEWLGGYDSWRRRMLRLAHISLVGTGLLNLAFAFSCNSLDMSSLLGFRGLFVEEGFDCRPDIFVL